MLFNKNKYKNVWVDLGNCLCFDVCFSLNVDVKTHFYWLLNFYLKILFFDINQKRHLLVRTTSLWRWPGVSIIAVFTCTAAIYNFQNPKCTRILFTVYCYWFFCVRCVHGRYNTININLSQLHMLMWMSKLCYYIFFIWV